jgi:hypothetical protein
MKTGDSGFVTSKALAIVGPAFGVPGSSCCSCETYSSGCDGLVQRHAPRVPA